MNDFATNFAHFYLVILSVRSELSGINNCGKSQICEIKMVKITYLLLILWWKPASTLNSSEMVKEKVLLIWTKPKKVNLDKQQNELRLFFQTPSVSVERALSGLHTRWIEEDSGKWQCNPVQPSANKSFPVVLTAVKRHYHLNIWGR